MDRDTLLLLLILVGFGLFILVLCRVIVANGRPTHKNFSNPVRQVMQFAHQEAQRFNHEYIGTEHILLGLLVKADTPAGQVLGNLGIDLSRAHRELEKIVQPGPDLVTMGRLPQTPKAKLAIEYAIEEAHSLGQSQISTEHLLLGLLRERDSVAGQILSNLGLTLDEVRKRLVSVLKDKQAESEG